ADNSPPRVVQLRFGGLQRPQRFVISSLLTNVDLRAGSMRPKHEPLARGHPDLIRYVRGGSGVRRRLHPNGCRESKQNPLLPLGLRRFHRGPPTSAAYREFTRTPPASAPGGLRRGRRMGTFDPFPPPNRS